MLQADLGYLSSVVSELLFICAQWQVEVVLNQVEGCLSQVECGTTAGMIRSRTKCVYCESADVVYKEFKGQYSINLKKHLKTCHTDAYKHFEAAEIEKTKEKERRGSSSQLKQSSLPIRSLGSKIVQQ